MAYIDAFVLVVPKKKLAAYKALAQKAGKVWKEHGALDYHECVGDDLNMGFGLPFPKLAGSKPSEVVMFSYIVYKSKAQRNAVNKKVMSDKRMGEMCDPKNMPFDMKRMACGGFKTLVQIKK